MSQEAETLDLNAFVQPNFDAQATVARLLASAHSSRTDRVTDDAARRHASNKTALKTDEGGQSSSQDRDLFLGAGDATDLPPLSPLTTFRALPDIPDAPSAISTINLDQDDGDLSLAISRLNLTIDEIQNSITAEVEANAPQLLQRMAGVSEMEQRLSALRSGVGALDAEVQGLRAKVHQPFVKLQERQEDLVRAEAASDLVAEASKFVTVARRLEAQMEVLLIGGSDAANPDRKAVEEDAQDAIVGQVRGRELARAALIINEITSMLKDDVGSTSAHTEDKDVDEAGSNQAEQQGATRTDRLLAEPSILGLDFVKRYLPSIDVARQTVTNYMEDMVVRGLRDLSPIMLGSSLQTAYNLGTLPDLVRDLLADLTEVVKERTRAAFDMASLGRELGGLEEPSAALPPSYASYRGRRQGTADTNSASAQASLAATWSSALFRRLETLIVVEMGAVCSKVYTLERVLRLKTDAETGVNFLDEALQVLGDRPSLTFWTTLATSFASESREAARRSPFVSRMLSSTGEAGKGLQGYTSLLRLYHQFFAKVSAYADLVYTANQQSPETVIVLRSLSHFEATYLDTATSRLTDVVGNALNPRRIPTVEEAETLVRATGTLLDAVRFDPLLTKAAMRRVEEFVKDVCTKVDRMALRDAAAYTLQAQDTTPSQALNGGLATFASHVSTGLSTLSQQQGDIADLPQRLAALATSLDRIWLKAIGEPLVAAVEREISTALARMHTANLGKSGPATAGDRVTIGGGSGSSVYMTELCDQLWFFREKVLVRFDVGVVKSQWALKLSKRTLRLFLLHASLLRPLSEAGKLKLAADMTALEFAIEQLVTDLPSPHSGAVAAPAPTPTTPKRRVERMDISFCGEEWRAVRAFRPFLFLSSDEILKDEENRTGSLPPYVVVHHLLARGDGQWPYEAKGWTRSKYVDWIMDQGTEQREVVQLLRDGMLPSEGRVAEWMKGRGGGEA